MIRAAWTTLLRPDPRRRRGVTAFAETRGRPAALEQALTACERERARLVDMLGHARPPASAPAPSREIEALREIEKAAAELTALVDDTAVSSPPAGHPRAA